MFVVNNEFDPSTIKANPDLKNQSTATTSSSNDLQTAKAGKIGGAILEGLQQGINTYFSTVMQRRSYEAQATGYEQQAQAYDLKAAYAKQAVYSAHEQGEWQAMQQGLADQQKTAMLRAQAASSGVRMNEAGSKREVEYSQRQAAQLNQIAIQRNTNDAAMVAKREAVSYQAQAIIARGNAKASGIMAKATSPLLALAVNQLNYGAQQAWSFAGK